MNPPLNETFGGPGGTKHVSFRGGVMVIVHSDRANAPLRYVTSSLLLKKTGHTFLPAHKFVFFWSLGNSCLLTLESVFFLMVENASLEVHANPHLVLIVKKR